jgi:hypothetical protein
VNVRCLPALALLILPARMLHAQVIENPVLRLEVSTQTGSIVGLRDKRNGTEYIADPAQARLFELLLPDAANYSRRIASWKQQPASVESMGDRIDILFRQLQPDQEQYRFGSGLMHIDEPWLPIEVLVTLRLQGDHIDARMSIANHSRTSITGVVFPYVGGLPGNTGAETAKIILPSVGQRVFNNTSGALAGQRTNRYPGLLASSWLQFELGSKGVGIELRSGLQAQDAYFALSPGPFMPGSAYRGRYEYPFIAWIHYPHIAGQGEWTSPPALLHVHDSDWHEMAAEHREWFRASGPLPPANAWTHALGFASYRLKRDDNTVDWTYHDLPSLAAAAEQAGLRRLVIEGWRKQEGPGNPAPFGELADPRLGGAPALKRVIGELQRKGTELLFAFHPALLNVSQDRYPHEFSFWTVKTRRQANQLPVDFLYHTVDYPDVLAGPRYSIEIDPASAASDFLIREAQRLRQEYGFNGLLLKGIGQRAFLSYNRHSDVAAQSAYAIGYARLLGELRRIYADGLLLNEGVNDLVNPFGDGAYTWNQSADSAVLAYSLPWSNYSNDVEAMDYAAANTAFAHKVLLNLIVDGGQGSIADYPAFARHLRSLQELKSATAPYYAEAEFRHHDGLKNVTEDAGIVVAVFANLGTPKTGIVLANLSEQTGKARFELPAAAALVKPRVFPDGAAALDGSVSRSVTLAPHQVIILAIDARLQP